MKLKRMLSSGLCCLLCGCAAAPSAVDTAAAGAYIEVPAQYRAWNEDGANQDHLRTAQGEGGAVVALKYEGARIGLDILTQGGNAVDAAVAVSFALGVCEPYDSGLGGGGMATYYCAETGQSSFLNFRETTPAAQTSLVDGDGLEHPSLQIGVPGQVAGIYTLWEQYGSMPWEQLLQPAIQLARQGYEVTPNMLGAIELIYGDIADHPELSEIYLRDGLPPQVGDVIQNEPLAQTLEAIAHSGPSAFYQDIAPDMETAVRLSGGYLTADDLLSYQPFAVEPAKGTYRGYQIISSPYGGSCLIEALNLLEILPVQPAGSLEQLDQMANVQMQVFTDRGQYMADTRFVEVPISGITNKDYAAKLAGKLDMSQAQTFLYDDPWPYVDDHYNTTGYEVADKEGNMVAVTKTLNYWWGSEVYVEDYGFFMNDQMDDFVTGKQSANSVEPGKAPLSSISPTVVLDAEGKPFAVLASPGGSAIYPCIAQLILNMTDYDMSLEEAFLAPRVICNGFEFTYDKLSKETVEELKALGHENILENTFPSPSGIRYADGKLEGIVNEANPDGAAVGF